ncbi:MAG TPA: hypothetical protein VMG40_14710 [Bryobacteraceae bacterium]|nr:hypothetical protein [Bryobacteraceae bacterium]
MSSVGSTSSVLSSLLQTLSTDSPVLSSALSSPNVQSALEKASPADIVQLSDAAVQLQEANLLFGSADQSGSAETASDSILQTLASSADPAASTEESQQAQEIASLFGAASTTEPLIDTLA